MNVNFQIPQELEPYLELQLRSGSYDSIADYFLNLLNQDRKRQQAKEKLTALLQESFDSPSQSVTADYWQTLKKSVLENE
jgi:antitoxin ParD1/3/4